MGIAINGKTHLRSPNMTRQSTREKDERGEELIQQFKSSLHANLAVACGEFQFVARLLGGSRRQNAARVLPRGII